MARRADGRTALFLDFFAGAFLRAAFRQVEGAFAFFFAGFLGTLPRFPATFAARPERFAEAAFFRETGRFPDFFFDAFFTAFLATMGKVYIRTALESRPLPDLRAALSSRSMDVHGIGR